MVGMLWCQGGTGFVGVMGGVGEKGEAIKKYKFTHKIVTGT